MPKLLYRSLLPLYKASLNMMNFFFLADSEAARRLSRPLARCTDQCLCDCSYVIDWLACSTGRHLFFCNKKHFFTNLSAILIDFRTETVVLELAITSVTLLVKRDRTAAGRDSHTDCVRRQRLCAPNLVPCSLTQPGWLDTT